MEGTEEDELVNGFEHFLFETQNGNGASETFIASTIATLATNSFLHSLTGVAPAASIEEETTSAYMAVAGRVRYGTDIFYGIMIDTGAANNSTVGINQVYAYQNTIDKNATINTATAGAVKIKFGIGETSSIGSICITTPIGIVGFHVVEADTPFLMSLRDLDELGCYYNNLQDVIVAPTRAVPVVRKYGHPFLLWGEILQQFITETLTTFHCYLTAPELVRLHRRFGHPSVERLHSLLEKSGHEFERNALVKLTKFCHYCQKYGKSPGRFKFKVTDDIDFNHTIIIDVFYIEGKPVLHIIDEATAFQSAGFLRDMTANTTWETLRKQWIDSYLGPPDLIVHDAGTNFTAEEFRQNANSMAVNTKCVPVEAHWSIGKVEQAHAALRRAFEIIREEAGTSISREAALQMACKAVNDTAGVNGLVPTLLVFGAYPRVSTYDTPAASMAQRAAAIRKAMEEVSKLHAKERTNRALNTRNGPNVVPIHDLPLNSNVLVYREDGNNRHRWKGPFKLLGITNEDVTVELPSGPTTFRSTHVKPYYKDHEEVDDSDEEGEAQPDGVKRKSEDAQPRRSQRTRRPTERVLAATINVSDSCVAVYIATPQFVESRLKEMNGLFENTVFKFINIDQVPEGARIFNSRFVDEVKNQGTEDAFEKSRLVIQAYNDFEKETVLTQAPTIQRSSWRIILSLAPSLLLMGMQMFLRDITQAYIQSLTRLQREFYSRPPAEVKKELGLGDDIVMMVMKPLYGVPEAGNHWYGTYHSHHTEELKMKESTYDPCLLYTHESGMGIVGLQFDDTLFVGDEEFAKNEEEKLKSAKFMAKERETLTINKPMKFNGGLMTLEASGAILLNQERQCENLNLVKLKTADLTSSRGVKRVAVTPKDQYLAQRARGAYVASVCQPEASFDLSFAAQIPNPKESDAKALNKRLQWQINNKARGLRYVPLDLKTLKLVVFTDGSFANNSDNSSQIGLVIVLADGENNANIVHWSSIKCKRVVRSVLASELYGMAHGFDHAAVIKSTIEKILSIELPLLLCTDSRSLYDCLVKLGSTQEKRLMVDLMCLRQSYERRMITEVVWIDGESNPADAMTKSKANNALRNLVDSNKIKLTMKEWVERNTKKSDSKVESHTG